MKLDEQYKGPRYGEIEVFVRKDGKDKVVLRKKNLILDSGMDLLAKAVAGQQFINGMYLPYSNAASPLNESSPTVDRTANYYQTTGSDNTKGFMRVPLAAIPSFDTTDNTKYNNNRAIFMAISDNNPAVPIAGNEVTPGTSKLYGAALAFLDPNDMANDVLYSAVTFTDLAGVLDEVTVLAGAQVGVRWFQSFLQP